MHPLRVLLVVSLAIAIIVASTFGALLRRAGVSTPESIILSAVVFIAYLVPWAGAFLWAVRRASDLETLIDRTRAAVEHETAPIADRTYHGELDELARGIDALRELLVEQRASMTEQRGAIRQIIGALGEGLMAVSPTGRVVFANTKITEMFGNVSALEGRSVLEVVRKRAVADAIEGALRGQATVRRIAAGSIGGERQIEVRAVPVTSSAEIAALALFIDVSDLDRLQKVRKDFLEDFSHEVRTPLAGLRTAAETLSGGRLTADQEDALRQIMLRQIHRIERLVRDISELNRIESGELVLEKRAVDLRELVAEVSSEFSKRNGLTIRGDAAAIADPERIQQVFTNLLDNAFKHGGGEVIVELATDKGEAAVRFLDSGEGLPEGETERIFNRFYRVDRSRSQDVPGLGLGLAIARHLMRLHGGTIHAWNRPEGGAAFEVRLPAA